MKYNFYCRILDSCEYLIETNRKLVFYMIYDIFIFHSLESNSLPNWN